MTISELVPQLNVIMRYHGDLDVRFAVAERNQTYRSVLRVTLETNGSSEHCVVLTDFVDVLADTVCKE